MKPETVNKLQDLVRVNIDSCKGFKQAAETVEGESLSRLFSDIATYRQGHADELRKLIDMADEPVPEDGTTFGTAHRWWLAARGALNSGDEKVVLIEVERAEDVIKARYEEAIDATKDSPVHSQLLNQFAEVKAGHDKIRDLRDVALKA